MNTHARTSIGFLVAATLTGALGGAAAGVPIFLLGMAKNNGDVEIAGWMGALASAFGAIVGVSAGAGVAVVGRRVGAWMRVGLLASGLTGSAIGVVAGALLASVSAALFVGSMNWQQQAPGDRAIVMLVFGSWFALVGAMAGATVGLVVGLMVDVLTRFATQGERGALAP